MATSKHYYDTSKYISLPIALLLAVTALILLTIVGMKYSAFSGELLSTRAARVKPLPAHVAKCIEEARLCTQQEATDYEACAKKVNAQLATCLKDIDPKKPKADRERARADCEIKAGGGADLCMTNVCEPGKGVGRCRTVADCIKKAHK